MLFFFFFGGGGCSHSGYSSQRGGFKGRANPDGVSALCFCRRSAFPWSHACSAPLAPIVVTLHPQSSLCRRVRPRVASVPAKPWRTLRTTSSTKRNTPRAAALRARSAKRTSPKTLWEWPSWCRWGAPPTTTTSPVPQDTTLFLHMHLLHRCTEDWKAVNRGSVCIVEWEQGEPRALWALQWLVLSVSLCTKTLSNRL